MDLFLDCWNAIAGLDIPLETLGAGAAGLWVALAVAVSRGRWKARAVRWKHLASEPTKGEMCTMAAPLMERNDTDAAYQLALQAMQLMQVQCQHAVDSIVGPLQTLVEAEWGDDTAKKLKQVAKIIRAAKEEPETPADVTEAVLADRGALLATARKVPYPDATVAMMVSCMANVPVPE